MLFVYGNRQFNRTGRGKFSGIGQQINQYLLQALGIRLDNQRSYRSFEQKQSAGLASILRCRQSRLTQLYYITFLPYEFYFPDSMREMSRISLMRCNNKSEFF